LPYNLDVSLPRHFTPWTFYPNCGQLKMDGGKDAWENGWTLRWTDGEDDGEDLAVRWHSPPVHLHNRPQFLVGLAKHAGKGRNVQATGKKVPIRASQPVRR